MNIETKRLLTFLAKAILIVVLIDFVLGTTLSKLYDRMNIGEKARANYFIKKDTSQVIIFGSSRALYHYQSKILSDSLQATVYNGGRSNQSVPYFLSVLKCILKRHTPKMIIFDVHEEELVKAKRKYEILSALLPYYRYDKDIASMYDKANPGYKYWSWSRTLPYNSSIFATIYRGLKTGKDKDIKGFLSHEGKMRGPMEVIDNCSLKYVGDPFLAECFTEFIQICKAKHIKLFLAASPRYAKYQCERFEFTYAKKLAAAEGFKIHDYTEIEGKAEYFSDIFHLNGKGAVEFSRIVAKDIKAFANQK